MDIHSEKLQILKWILETEDKEILNKIKDFFQVASPGKRTSRKQYNKEIEEAESRLNKGKGIAHKDILKQLEKL